MLSKAVPAMLRCMDEREFDVEIVETVGAGQADFEICQMTDVSLLLLMPGAGDELQFEKAGVIELADIIVINKADRPDADALLTQCREILGPDRDVLAEWGDSSPRVRRTRATPLHEHWQASCQWHPAADEHGGHIPNSWPSWSR